MKQWRSILAFIPGNGFCCTYWIVKSTNTQKRNGNRMHISGTTAASIVRIHTLRRKRVGFD